MNSKILSNMFGASADLPRIVEIDLNRIQPNPDQPRKFFNDSGLIELAQSIESKGLLQPILVREVSDGEYMIVAGERRFRASQLLSTTTIAASITEGDTDEIAIIENVQRENLRPMELAESLGRLMETHGYTQDDVAKIIGKARSTVTELLSLLKLPDHIKSVCRMSDTIRKSFLVELARMDQATMESVWINLQEGGEQTVRTVRAIKTEGSPSSKPPSSTHKKLEQALRKAIQLLQNHSNQIPSEERSKIQRLKNKLDETFDLAF